MDAHRRRGQMQIGEMVMVIVVVALLAIIGLVWYTHSAEASSVRAIDADAQIELAETAHFVADMPDIRYSLAGHEDTTIIDWMRAQAFSAYVDNASIGRPLFRDRFAGYSAYLTCVTPCADGPDNKRHPFGGLKLFDYTDANAAKHNSVPFVIPVLLYDPVTKDSSFGMLTLTQVLS